MMKRNRLLLVISVVCLILAYFSLDLGRFLSLEYLKNQRAALESWRAAQPLTAAVFFFTTYIIITGLSLPGATVMSLGIGAVFGLFWGVLLVSFASSIGATLACLTARYLFRDWVQLRFGERLKAINAGIERDGAYYLFTLRLVPVFPYFIINLLMGLTPIRIPTYYMVTQAGMLAANLVFVNAGTELAKIDVLSDILSPGVIGSLILLGLFPLAMRKIVAGISAKNIRTNAKN
ncbi:MAG: TVP38/TMEM64 family protein [Betaproteobacteria bacterium]